MKRDEPIEPSPIAVRLKRAARMLGLSERATWELASWGELPSIRLADRVRLFEVEALRRWVRERAAEARVLRNPLPNPLPNAPIPGGDSRSNIGGTGGAP